jgi:hypothetical protein
MGEHQESTMKTHLREWVKFATSRQIVPTIKGATAPSNSYFHMNYMATFQNLKDDTEPSLGSLAYTLAIALVFIWKYDDLSSYPLTLASMIIITITGGPGKPLGACVQAVALAMGGVLLGCGFFAILALLAAAPVAQGVVLALIVYRELSSMCVSLLLTLYLCDSDVDSQGSRPEVVHTFTSVYYLGIQRSGCFYLLWSYPHCALPDLHLNTSEWRI